MAIILIPHTYSIEVQISDYTLTGHVQAGGAGYGARIFGQRFYIEQELEDTIFVGGNYTNTVQQFWFQLYIGDGSYPSASPINLYIPEDTPLHFFIYPCRPNTQYTVYTGDRGYTSIGTVITDPENTQYNSIYDVSQKLTFDDSVANTEVIRKYLDVQGWSPEAIAAVLGLMYCQSGVNPANIGYYYDGTPYSASGSKVLWCTNTTLVRADCETIPYINDIDPTPSNPYWQYGEYPINDQQTPTWAGVTSGARGAAINITGGGFGLLGITPFDQYLLYPQSNTVIFPAGRYWSGEGQLEWLDLESRFNYYWEYDWRIDNRQLPEQYREITFRDFRTMAETPETMAHIFLAHKAKYIDYGTYNSTLACAQQWARYFYKPKQSKRHKMPLWEYLRYTV